MPRARQLRLWLLLKKVLSMSADRVPLWLGGSFFHGGGRLLGSRYPDSDDGWNPLFAMSNQISTTERRRTRFDVA